MDYTHIGWIPCINGHLDFGLMQPTLSGGFTNSDSRDEKVTCVSYSYNFRNNSHHARRFMMQSKVDWRDTLQDHYDGNFRVFVVAESNESELLDNRVLKGKIYIYRQAIEAVEVEKRQKLPQFKAIHGARECLSKFNRSDDGQQGWSDAVINLNGFYKDLSESLGNLNEVYTICFKVTHNGVSYLNLEQDVDDEHRYAMVRQAFYYLKYSLHEHKHHNSQTDSLTTIVEMKNDSSAVEAKNDSSVCEEAQNYIGLKMLGQLKRELTSIKRSYSQGTTRQETDAQGVIAYTSSLIETLHSSKLLTTGIYLREKEYLKSLSSSFTAQTDKIKRESDRIEKIYSKNRIVVGWGLSILGIFLIFFRSYYLVLPEKREQISYEYNLTLTWFCILFFALIFLARKVYILMASYEINKTDVNHKFMSWTDRYYKNVDDAQFRKRVSLEFMKPFLLVLVLIGAIIAVEKWDIYPAEQVESVKDNEGLLLSLP